MMLYFITTIAILLLMILLVCIFVEARRLFTRIVEKPVKFSVGEATNATNPVSILEVKVTLPSRLIFSDEAVASKYDPSGLVRLPHVRLDGGTLGPLFKVVLDGGSIVAVRKIREGLVKPDDCDKLLNFFGRIHGRCLLPILFSFWYGEEAFVVYEYMCLGSLEELLHGREGIQFTPLSWETRRYIALCASMAVASIHSQVSEKGEALVWGVIKASNILIRIDFTAHMSGYETAYFVSSEAIIKRNPGRVAPELLRSPNLSDGFTKKSDVYSFGILLLELITGKKPMVSDEHGELKLVNYVKCKRKMEGLQGIYDEKMTEIKDTVANMVEIAELCLLQDPNERPTMDRVVQMIQELQE